MRANDFLERVEEKFTAYLNQMTLEELLLVEKAEERIRIKQYRTKGESSFPFKKVTFMLLVNGWVYNKDDKSILDEGDVSFQV